MRKLRSLLTALGIVFGVCSVIAMLAIGEGASFEAQEQIKNLGSQNVILKSVEPPEAEDRTESETIYLNQFGLTYRDIKQIKETIPGVSVIVPTRTFRERLWNLTRSAECEVHGTVPWFPSMKNLRLKSGRFFGEVEMQKRVNVCVLDESAARSLFPLSTPLGKSVRVRGTYFRVVGVSETSSRDQANGEAGNADSQAADEDNGSSAPRMFVPLNTMLERFGDVVYERSAGGYNAEKVELSEVTVKVDDAERVVGSANAIRHILERNHEKTDYTVTVPVELLRNAERTKQIFNIVLGSIAAISLLVGGIGIMNIMLANVTERTREIGIRRALGAKRADIVFQFLIETVLLSGAGGVIGVLLGITIPWVVSKAAGMLTIVSFEAPALAFTISVLVGILFGIYPALKASEMNPVEALRHE